MVSEIVGLAEVDFQILDMEHGVFDTASLDASIRACESVGCSPLVRVASLQTSSIQTALDLGAHGIVVPQIQDFNSASAAVSASKFAPEGIRGYNPFVRAGHYRGVTKEKMPKLSNAFGLTMIIIENAKAYEDLDRILTIRDLDAVYLGVYDMSVALNCMGDTTNPKILKFLESSIPRIRKAGKAACLMVNTREDYKKYLDLGANVFLQGVDSAILTQAVSGGVALFQSVRGSKKK